MEKRIAAGLAAYGLPTDTAPVMAKYAQLMLTKNEVLNLTAITETDGVCDLHFLDSAFLASRWDLADKTLIDVGTGAGFPGLVLKILEPSLKLTLLDGLQKRLNWLQELCESLGIKGVNFLHIRAEEGGNEEDYRDHFDFATARAVANMSTLSELCLPYVKVGGTFLAMKTTESGEEICAAEHIVRRLGGKLNPSVDYRIPGTEISHRIVPVEKLEPTPAGFPRRWAKIKT
ncbi:MAG: 16S rRNA (guanine(527)-N(7))-methyltransferase RsmG [Oscillospiraceae bacterium]